VLTESRSLNVTSPHSDKATPNLNKLSGATAQWRDRTKICATMTNHRDERSMQLKHATEACN
jgi:hypothetical protein